MKPESKELLKGSIPIVIMIICIISAAAFVIINDLSFEDVYDFIMNNYLIQSFGGTHRVYI